MENRKRTAKRWRENEQRMLDAIASKFGADGVVAVHLVPLDMWPPDRTIGASCYQLNQNGWRTTGLSLEARRMSPAAWFELNTGRADLFKPETRKRAKVGTVTTTTTWLWGLYKKTVTK